MESHRLGKTGADGLHSITETQSPVPAADGCFVELPRSAWLLIGAVAATDVTERTNNVHKTIVVSCQFELPLACAILLLWNLLLHDAVCSQQSLWPLKAPNKALMRKPVMYIAHEVVIDLQPMPLDDAQDTPGFVIWTIHRQHTSVCKTMVICSWQ